MQNENPNVMGGSTFLVVVRAFFMHFHTREILCVFFFFVVLSFVHSSEQKYVHAAHLHVVKWKYIFVGVRKNASLPFHSLLARIIVTMYYYYIFRE